MRTLHKMLIATAASLVVGTSLAIPADATVPGGGGATCTAFSTVSFTSTTATAHVAGTDNCATPRYWVRMEVGLNTSSGSPSKDVLVTCTLNVNSVEACAEKGASASVSNPAGTQTWSFCGTLYYYSNITSGLVKTIESCGSARG